MKYSSIKMIQGYHLTQTESKALLQMLNNGLTNATNKPRTKQYLIVRGTPITGGYEFEVRIGTRERRTIGADVTTTYNQFVIHAK
jgi:hypothetical protein